jgi:hypothetical protein
LRSIENPWVRDTVVEKKWREIKMGGIEIFYGSVENPLIVLGTGEGCFKILEVYCEILF